MALFIPVYLTTLVSGITAKKIYDNYNNSKSYTQNELRDLMPKNPKTTEQLKEEEFSKGVVSATRYSAELGETERCWGDWKFEPSLEVKERILRSKFPDAKITRNDHKVCVMW